MALTAQELQQRVGMRPTLLVGLGGTGQKVLIQLKARFLRNYGEVPPAIEFLCFDTDQTAEQTQIEGRVVRLTADTELVNIGGIETPNIIRNLDKYPSIAAWIAEDKERIPTRAIVMGAQQVRPLGRLSLFWRVELIHRKLQSAVQRLTDLKLGIEQKGINVFVISSVCGGTGSGIFLDVAYLTRHVIERSGLQSSFCYVNGVLALPSVFPNVAPVGIQSNSYAALAELDYFMESGDWRCEYGNPRVSNVEFSGQRPFNICYLVDARNEQGQGLAGLEEIAPMIAEAIYLQISSQVGTANNSAFDNVRVLASRTLFTEEDKYKPTAYSSLGTSSLIFPVFKIIDLCAHRLGRDLIQQELLARSPRPDQVEPAVNGFLQANQLETDALLQQIARDAKGNLLRIGLDPRVLDRFRESELFSATQAYLTKAESTLDNEFSQTLDLNRKALAERLATALGAELDRLADDPLRGVPFAVAFLEKLDAVLATARVSMDKSRAEMDQRRDKAQAQLRQTLDAYSTSFRSMPIGRSGRIKEARGRHVEMFQNYLAARFESRKREMAIALLANLSTTIQAKRAALQGLADRLQFIQSQFGAFVERFSGGKSRTDFVLAQDITTEADIERYYTEHFGRLGASPSASLLDTQGPLHTWVDLEQDEITDRILRYTRSVFDDLHQISIEQIVTEKREQVDPDKRLQDLVNRSSPFWMYRKEGVLGQDWEGEQIVVIGVTDRERSIYKNLTEASQVLTSTFDPHQITVLQTKHGVPLFALTRYKDFKQDHDHVLRADLKPLYVFPEVRPGGEKARQIFALGVAYGFVFKSGTFYHILPEDAGTQPVKLETGMEKSLSRFRNSDELIGLVSRHVESQIAREGSDPAIEILEGFMREPYVYELKGGAARTNLDRTMMTPDKSVGKPGSANYDLVMQMRETLKTYVKQVLRG
jgi:hypothetical protein